jgi:hypothetical protein
VPVVVMDRPYRLAARVMVAEGLDDAGPPQDPRGPAVADVPFAPEAGRLPLGRLAGLAGSGAFALWTSVTCFVC